MARSRRQVTDDLGSAVAQRQSRPPRQVRKVQRVAAYAVILRDDDGTTSVLLSRLSSKLTSKELWTLPGGGLEHGEDPRDAVVREVHEETGLDVEIGETAHVYSSHQSNTWRQGRRADSHSLRIVYDGWVPVDAPEPRVVEVDGSTAEAAWKPLAQVLDGTVPTVSLVAEVLEKHRTFRLQRVAAYALAVADGRILLVRNSARGPYPGGWSLPGGGIDHGESPRDALVREVAEETGLACEVGDVVDGDRLALRGHRALGAPRGLPHRPDHLRGAGERRRAPRGGDRRHRRRGRVGRPRRRRRPVVPDAPQRPRGAGARGSAGR